MGDPQIPSLPEEVASGPGFVPLVERDGQRRALEDLAERAITRGRSTVVDVAGRTGMGRSRLVEILRDLVDGEATWIDASSPRLLLRRLVGAWYEDAPEVALARLREHALEVLPSARAEGVIAALGPTLGVEPATPVGRDRAEVALGVLVAATARRGPLVVASDGNGASVITIGLQEMDAPLLVVNTGSGHYYEPGPRSTKRKVLTDGPPVVEEAPGVFSVRAYPLTTAGVAQLVDSLRSYGSISQQHEQVAVARARRSPAWIVGFAGILRAHAGDVPDGMLDRIAFDSGYVFQTRRCIANHVMSMPGVTRDVFSAGRQLGWWSAPVIATATGGHVADVDAHLARLRWEGYLHRWTGRERNERAWAYSRCDDWSQDVQTVDAADALDRDIARGGDPLAERLERGGGPPWHELRVAVRRPEDADRHRVQTALDVLAALELRGDGFRPELGREAAGLLRASGHGSWRALATAWSADGD